MKLTITRQSGNWVLGKFGERRFEAKIYPAPSDFGIKSGHVSKLWVEGLVNYDRGWDYGKSHAETWEPLVEHLNKFAQGDLFKTKIGVAS